LKFTEEEYDHLYTCPDCLRAWWYIEAVVHGGITGYERKVSEGDKNE
jgi:hypothetical protein